MVWQHLPVRRAGSQEAREEASWRPHGTERAGLAQESNLTFEQKRSSGCVADAEGF